MVTTLKSKLLPDYSWGTIFLQFNLIWRMWSTFSFDECAVPCKCMPRIVRGGLYMYSNRHRLNARDRYRRKEKNARARVCIPQKKSLTCGWFVGVDLRTQHLVDLRPHVSLAGCQAYVIYLLTCWTSIHRVHWSDTSLIFVCKTILHYIVGATFINTVLFVDITIL